MNVTVRVLCRNAEGDIDLQHLIVPLYTEGKVTAYCLAVPYLRQGDYPSAENYSKQSNCLMKQLFNEVKEKGLPVIAMGHLGKPPARKSRRTTVRNVPLSEAWK